MDFDRLTDDFLSPLVQVVRTAQEHAPDLSPDSVMLVGAWCRDVIHASLGHDFETSATRDIDLALALSGWETFELLAAAFPRVGDTGLRYEIAGHRVDLLPFGELEHPIGTVAPPTRDDPISVWAFDEVYQASLPLGISPTDVVRLPTIPGYTATKLAAWLDRSAWQELKDANDLALAAYWYVESPDVEARLYDTTEGQQILLAEDVDVPRAATRLLGQDVTAVIGADRLAELSERWPGDVDMLVTNFALTTGPRWPQQEPRRRDLIDALTRGLSGPM